MRGYGVQVLMCFVLTAEAVAGGGHLHGYSGGHTDVAEESVVLLGSDAITNIGIKTVGVKFVPPTALRVRGVVEQHPEGVVSVSAPTGGAVTKIVAQPGEAVKRGATVALFSPFQVGASSVPLVSPIDGVVGSVSARLGVGHEAGTTLFSVVDPEKRGFVAPLTRGEASQLKVRVGDPVRISVRGDAQPFRGRIYRIEQAGVVGTPIGRIVIELFPRDGALAPLGAVGALVVPSQGEARVVVLSRDSLVGTVVKPVVFVRRGNRFERRPVVLGHDWGDAVEITRGLKEGEDVVAQGAYQLNLARSDTFDTLTTGPHGGVIAVCPGGEKAASFAEIKLHDDKGDIELWLGEDGAFATPRRISPASKIALRFHERDRSIELAVRDQTSNKDEDGVARLREGLTDYFIFPGATGGDAAWLRGGEFIDEVTLTVHAASEPVVCETVTLVPHTHGAGAHEHGSAEAGHDHREGHSH